MVKSFCDVCGREIKPRTLRGAIIRLRGTFTLVPPVPSPLSKPGKAPSNMVQQVGEEALDLCEDCQKWIWERLEQRKKEFEDKSNKEL